MDGLKLALEYSVNWDYPQLLSPAHSEPATTFYGRDGSYQGSAFTYGNQRTFSGKLRALAVTAATRSDVLPDIPK